jgi:hypothetical protein
MTGCFAIAAGLLVSIASIIAAAHNAPLGFCGAALGVGFLTMISGAFLEEWPYMHSRAKHVAKDECARFRQKTEGSAYGPLPDCDGTGWYMCKKCGYHTGKSDKEKEI